MSERGNESVDPLLVPFLSAIDANDADRHLSRLIVQSTPLITGIVRAKLRVSLDPNDGGVENQDALEMINDVQALVFKELRRLKNGSTGKGIGDFRSYLAVLTYHACYQHLRRKYPERWRLKNRLRYLLSHRSNLTLWKNDQGQFLCALAEWNKSKMLSPTTAAAQLPREFPTSFKMKLSSHDLKPGPLTDLIVFILEQSTGPVVLDDLVNLVSDVCEIGGPPVIEQIQESMQLADPRLNFAITLERRIHLQQLWEEIRQLPLRHRAAILLNLRDERGRGLINLLPLARVATIRQIAEALAFPLEDFANVWNQLPWDDSAIAQHLGLTRQQVINLRHSARARLARRLKDY
jgi:hypothetical protein